MKNERCCGPYGGDALKPTTRREFDIIRWYLMHPGTRVYCEDNTGSWFVQFMSRCENLRPDNLCGIYDTRPQICRDLEPTKCEFALGAGDRFLFTKVAEFESWMVERERRRAERRARRHAAPPPRSKPASKHAARKKAAGMAMARKTAGGVAMARRKTAR